MARIIIKDDEILAVFKRWRVSALKEQKLNTALITQEIKRLNNHRLVVGYTVLQKLKDMEKRGILVRADGRKGENHWYIREGFKEGF